MSGKQLQLLNDTKASGKATHKKSLKLTKHAELSQSSKSTFYRMLKCLLEEPRSLHDGKWCKRYIYQSHHMLIYGKKSCKVSVKELDWYSYQGVVATIDIYLRWRDEEYASLSNLQKVQNELKFLGVQNEKLDACFNMAKREFLKEPSDSVKNNCTLQVICDEFILSFASGKRNSEIVVLYDEEKNTPIYHVSRAKE